jgi:asparagine synthase (glutamine-hydrolysing)
MGTLMELSGDDTGAKRKLVHLASGSVYEDWAPLVQAHAPRVSPAGCQFLLAYGLVPPPFTLYEDVYALGIGDRLQGERFRVDFPYLEEKSRGTSKNDTAELERHLAQAVERSLAGDTLIMQSGGKDSAALLIGAAACGAKNVQSATYRPNYREDEAPHAARLAKRFGIPHRIVDADPRAEMQHLLELCAGPSVCADVAIAGYARTLGAIQPKRILDGLGGDIYMGYVQPRREAWLSMLSLPRRRPEVWGAVEPRGLEAIGSYAVKSALMYPAERMISGSHLSPRSVRELIPIDTPFTWFFQRLDRNTTSMRPTDRRAYVRGRIYDGAGTMEKARLSAAKVGGEVVFPLCDPDLVAYYFHLPEREKYDEAQRITKLPLRALLAARIGDSRFFEEKGSFRYDVLSFVRANRKMIEDEVRGAGGELSNVDRWLSFLLARSENYVHAYSLFSLFMLAAWLNRRPKAALASLHEGFEQRVRIEP